MDKQLQIPQEVRGFLESLLQDAGMKILDEQMREEMIKELYARLDNHLTSVIVENMPAEHLDAFMRLNEEKKPKAEIEQFLQDKMPNSKEVFAKAFAQFRELYLGNIAIARNAPRK